MLSIEKAGAVCANKELRTIRIGTSVGHAKDSWLRVRQLKIFILKILAINALAAPAVLLVEVTTLTHESRDDTMEGRAFIGEAKLVVTSAQQSEIVCCLRHYVAIEAEDNTPRWLPTNFHIKVALGIDIFRRCLSTSSTEKVKESPTNETATLPTSLHSKPNKTSRREDGSQSG